MCPMSDRNVASYVASIMVEIQSMADRLRELETECARLTKENASLWESIHAEQDARRSA